MTSAQVAALFGVWAIAVVSPGPDLVVVLQRALAGRRHGVATAVGIVAGISVWLVAAFAGLAALVRVYPALMTGLQVAGGALLATLGVLGMRGWWRARARSGTFAGNEAGAGTEAGVETGSGERQPPPRGAIGFPGGDVARGLATNLANPKALVFFGAVLTPFLSGEVPAGRSAFLVVGMIAVALAWFCGIAVAASHRRVNERVGRLMPWVDVVASGLFVVVGVAFVIEALA
ncbi:LysE family translocator [Rhodococcus sp. IEGM 1408]|uniref:LysE family translocator n=1 Tax=Rhodococcus sp. IEGM 1408 TaxID=3082220 RepID=UPI002953CB21|nr:LysE family translocator [Rhodococcus sp. IEGM 1408]MDV8000175.1 LysE family translocator [Rhodococcus sp. IEGM 1408]